MREVILEEDRAFIERMDMFFLASADSVGQPQCSYKGGDPGFVRVLDPKTLAFPNYDGNGMYLSMGNTLENPEVGLLFIDFENRKRMRLNGTASIVPAASISLRYPEAQFVVKVAVRQVFPHCPRYLHKLHRVERSSFGPHPDVTTPVPARNRRTRALGVLP